MPGGHVQQGTQDEVPGQVVVDRGPAGPTPIDRPVAVNGSRASPTPVVVDGWHVIAGEVSAQLRRCGVAVRAGAHASLAAEIEIDGGEAAPSALVLVAAGRLAPMVSAPWHRHGVPHLPVSVGLRDIIVGPLVVPGRTPCLACVGAAWPATREPGSMLEPPGAATVLAAAVATVTVLATLRGDYSMGGISTEVAHDGTAFLHRLWKVRADCRCASVRMVR
ncbi:MAG: hypothetical protein ACRCXL_17195 [Dermatophilaceae bacterium]